MRAARFHPLWDVACAVLQLDRSPAAVAAVLRTLAVPARGRASLWRLVDEFGYGPLVHLYLEQAGQAGAIAPERRAALSGAFEAGALRAGVLKREALWLTRRLGQEDIPVLWVKGIWLATFVYERPALRFMEDRDLVVPEEHWERSCAIALEGGYEIDPLGRLARREVHATSLRKSVPAVGRDGYVRIDLHGRIQSGERDHPGAAALWASARKAALAGATIHVPSPEWGFLIAALHAFRHACDSKYALSAVADAAAIRRRYGATLDWASLEEHASNPVTAVAVYVLMSLAASDTADEGAARFHRKIRRRIEALGVQSAADRMVRDSRRLDRLRVTDFSLFRFGEPGTLLRSAPREMRDFFSSRGRQVTRLGEANVTHPAPVSLARQALRLLGSNWRFAIASYRAGRLAAPACPLTAPAGAAHNRTPWGSSPSLPCSERSFRSTGSRRSSSCTFTSGGPTRWSGRTNPTRAPPSR